MAIQLPLDELTLVLARIRGLLLTEEKVADGVRLLARAAASSIPGTTGAGVSLLDRQGRRTSSGSTDDVVSAVDSLQYALNEGPCLSAWTTGTTVRSGDLQSDERWPLLAASIAPAGVRSVVSTPLVAGGHSLGALKVYASDTDAFTSDTEHLLELFAGAAAILLNHIQTTETPHRISAALAESLDSRDLVSRACGALMERHGIEQEQAMRRLLRRASDEGATLRQVSAAVLKTSSSGGDQ